MSTDGKLKLLHTTMHLRKKRLAGRWAFCYQSLILQVSLPPCVLGYRFFAAMMLHSLKQIEFTNGYMRIKENNPDCWGDWARLCKSPQSKSAPVHRARKFSAVLGTWLPYRPITMRPAVG